jgi:hypothetical protein
MSPQICAVTFDAFRRQAFRAGFSEGQDVLRECADVDFIHLEPSSGFELKEYWHRRLAAKDISGTLARINPGLRQVRLKKEYDLFIFFCPVWLDAMFINAVQGWRDHCKTSVCWINELWAGQIPEQKRWLPSLNRFDHLFLGTSGSVEPVKQVTGGPCHFLPVGIDALRFSPYPTPPSRVIDIYSIGRKLPGIHRALLKLASEKRLFYLHDTLQHGDSKAQVFREHRELFADIAKRSKFFLVAPSKIDFTEHTFGQSEVAARYFEGAAAGAVMMGQVPNCDAYRQMFAWPDAVIELEVDGSDANEVFSGLLADPDRINEISRRNVVGALLQHDWVYRWERIFRAAGLEPSEQMNSRKQRLMELSESPPLNECNS